MTEIEYALNTFYLLVCAALVMWMAAGFTMLEAGSERTYSGMAEFMFQVVFVATAMSIVSGAVAERMKLWSLLAFSVVMTAVIYPWQGYWSWGGGFLSTIGYSDYAGGGIVHMGASEQKNFDCRRFPHTAVPALRRSPSGARSLRAEAIFPGAGVWRPIDFRPAIDSMMPA